VVLNPVERLAALRWRVAAPVSAVKDVEVLRRTRSGVVDDLVTMGFAARTAPARGLVTVGPRASSRAGGKALVVSYFGRTGVLVRLDPARSRWGLFLVSTRHADHVAAQIRAAAGVGR